MEKEEKLIKEKRLEAFLQEKKKLAEKNKKKSLQNHKIMKDNYYAFYSDIKTNARDNGEW